MAAGLQNKRLGVAAIADPDTITGLCLGGIGERRADGSTNVLAVTLETAQATVEAAMERMLADESLGIIVLSQAVAGRVRHLLTRHTATLPTVLTLPDKGSSYEPLQDPIMARVSQLLGGSLD
ncbi:hypothetical protein FNF27_06640 [Cafeteria roenbergensis]|uniref:V-type proton ATPase subunit F n=2 Tax=Cafeteria roenbergensis TaxID=33653 RepID=A0A5A8CIY6_CAFRO|nr:hypothetical protein FNF29_03695 [Cafeteria roenbergensis]KAA0165720.1 hypothetical protein FNF31_01697 [Cafeteria roenbergensis]KAA0170383.1 hypothetical protein FNF27_06640 [Cafeteria roenbergensis]KAA0171442.1 hypothetical protein FNF28_00654 [Cafeteria roenbergensis]|eukprot:KAA0152808.1 hypothetical protein FNF29_03695 [Cafeteria roenbergensis]